MWSDDAVHVTRNAIEDGATALIAYVEERDSDLARERARVEGAARHDPPRVEGGPIVEGRDRGGRRDFLNGVPIQAGEPLYLLTWKGWAAVRYESNGLAGAVPGVPSVARRSGGFSNRDFSGRSIRVVWRDQALPMHE